MQQNLFIVQFPGKLCKFTDIPSVLPGLHSFGKSQMLRLSFLEALHRCLEQMGVKKKDIVDRTVSGFSQDNSRDLTKLDYFVYS